MYLREDDPDELTAGKRLDEIACILAGGVLAMRQPGATMATDSETAECAETCLDPRPYSNEYTRVG